MAARAAAAAATAGGSAAPPPAFAAPPPEAFDGARFRGLLDEDRLTIVDHHVEKAA